MWFVIVIMWLLITNGGLGVTSIIRELAINPKHYENLQHLVATWVNIVKENATILKIKGLYILIGDGVKQSKEGKIILEKTFFAFLIKPLISTYHK